MNVTDSNYFFNVRNWSFIINRACVLVWSWQVGSELCTWQRDVFFHALLSCWFSVSCLIGLCAQGRAMALSLLSLVARRPAACGHACIEQAVRLLLQRLPRYHGNTLSTSVTAIKIFIVLESTRKSESHTGSAVPQFLHLGIYTAPVYVYPGAGFILITATQVFFILDWVYPSAAVIAK